MLRNTTTSRDKGGPGTGGPWSPIVGESVPIHKPERRSTVVWERPDGVPDVCARFILARLNFDSESSASHDEMRLLNLFATQSNKSNNILINLDVCL